MASVRWALLVLLILGGMVTASLGADGDGWRATVQWMQQQHAMLQRYLLPCPPLHSGAMPAGSGGGYAAVAQAAERGGAPADEELLRAACRGDVRSLGEPLQAALLRLRPACDQLRAAARGADALLPPELDVLQLLQVVDALLLTAVRAEPGLAVAQDLLDVFACGIDLANAAHPLQHMIGGLVVQRATEVLSDDVLRRLGVSAQQALAEGLAAADGVLQPESMLPLLQARWLVARLDGDEDVQPADIGLATRWQAWRQGFSVRDSGRARTRALVASLQTFVRDSITIEGWSARRALLRKLVETDRAINADLWHPFLTDAEQNEAVRRTAVAELRLLRVALAWHLHATLPTLADPLGDGALQVIDVDGGVLLRSGQPDVQRACRRE